MVGAAKKILFSGKVVDNEDPFVLGRVRIFPNTDEDNESVLLSQFEEEDLINTPYGKDLKYELRYSKNDPFVFLPLIPSLISCIPKVDEFVWVTYSNPRFNRNRQEQFYIPGSRTNAVNLNFESYNSSLTNTNQGFNFAVNNSLKNSVPSEGTKRYTNENLKGVFAEPGDTAIYGRGSTDIVLKENVVLLRAGKTNTIFTNTEKQKNRNRAFIQLSYIEGQTIILDPTTVETEFIDDSSLSYLIEYNITNIENGYDIFSGSVNIYQIPDNANLKNNEFNGSTDVPVGVSTPIWHYNLENLPMTAVTTIINTVIDGFNDGLIEIKEPFTPKKLLVSELSTTKPRFPFYYRPSKILRNPQFYENVDTEMEYQRLKNLNALTSKVKFSYEKYETTGEGLICRQNKTGICNKLATREIPNSTSNDKKTSVTIQASDKLLLLSYETKPIPGKSPISLGENTLYGVEKDEIYSNIIVNTEPMVRGDKLKELLSIMSKFLTSHVHAYHGLPPNPSSFSEVTTEDIDRKFQSYDSEVLNQNIRIN